MFTDAGGLETSGIEPRTFWLGVKHPNHSVNHDGEGWGLESAAGPSEQDLSQAPPLGGSSMRTAEFSVSS